MGGGGEERGGAENAELTCGITAPHRRDACAGVRAPEGQRAGDPAGVEVERAQP